MDPAGTPALHEAIRKIHGCDSIFVEWVVAHDMHHGQVVWEREVGVFDLVGHPRAGRAYAWSEATTGAARRFFAVLHIPPIVSPEAAVLASIVADAKSR
jgi:hypothetical protein